MLEMLNPLSKRKWRLSSLLLGLSFGDLKFLMGQLSMILSHFEIRRNEDEFPRRVIHVVDSSAGLPRPHDCVADFDVQWYLAPLILDLTSR